MNNAYANKADRNDYNISSSQTAQANFQAAAAHLESVLTQRDGQIKALMGQYQADGVSDKYRQLEHNWNQAGTALRGIVTSLKKSLEKNDGIAQKALSDAAAAVTL